MTDEKKPEADEVSEEQLEDVSGGVLDLTKAPPKSTDDGPTRNAYFDGKLLDEKDLEEEQKYPPRKTTG